MTQKLTDMRWSSKKGAKGSRTHETYQVRWNREWLQSFYDHGTPGFADLNLTETRKEDADVRRERERERNRKIARMHGGRVDRFVEKFADQIAYLRVHSRAVASYRGRSVL